MYSSFLPLVSLLHAAIDAAQFLAGLLHPVYALTGAVVLFMGWLAQIIIWGLCYGNNSFLKPMCPEWRLARTYAGGTPLARLVFGVVLALLYLAYLVLAAIAIHRARKAAKDKLPRGDDIGMSDKGSRHA